MYMTSDQYSWAMMKHGHKMLISSVCVRVFLCVRYADGYVVQWLMFGSDSLSLFACIDWFRSFFLSSVDCSISNVCSISIFLSFFLSLCITHISLNAHNIFRWTIAFQSVMFGFFFYFISSFVLFSFPQLLGYVRKRSSDRLTFFLRFIFIYIENQTKKRNIKWTSFVQKFENKKKLHSKIHLSHTHSLVQIRTKIVCFWRTKSK